MNFKYYDIICVGAGGGGIISAQNAAREKSAKVALISKITASIGNTRISGGNFAGVGFHKNDNPEEFYQNIYSAGGKLGHPDVIKALAQEAVHMPQLVEDIGLFFKRDQDDVFGESVVFRRGGHSYGRTLALPAKGIGLGNALRASIARSNVSVFEGMIATDLISDGDRVYGVICYDLVNGEFISFLGKAVILATGGGGWLFYPHTTNVCEATGDGFALALSCGARLVNMEQIQFQPFGLAKPSYMIGLPCGEPAHGGPFGRILSADGNLILENFNKMTRAQVANIVSQALQDGLGTENDGLYLDLSGNKGIDDGGKYMSMLGGPSGILKRVRRALGEKAARLEEPWEISPSAHFFMGGVQVDANGFSGIKGLYAVGEVQGCLHGANRLGTVALTELFVFGQRVGCLAAEEDPIDLSVAVKTMNMHKEEKRESRGRGIYRPIQLIRKLQKAMWAGVNPIRDKAGLLSVLETIEELKEKFNNISVCPLKRFNTEKRDALELEKMLMTAEAICRSALIREESRGAHCRQDFPQTWETPCRAIIYKKNHEMRTYLDPEMQNH